MAVPKPVERIYHRWADWLFARLPQAVPSPEQARRCRIVSHRGEHDIRVVPENTLGAFDRARDAGVWGIECDVRWTSDLEPVVFHDRDCRRLFGHQALLKDLTWKEVQHRFPTIPSLRQVIERYGKQLHLMVEIKTEPFPNLTYQNDILRELFSQLAPTKGLSPAVIGHRHLPATGLCPNRELPAGGGDEFHGVERPGHWPSLCRDCRALSADDAGSNPSPSPPWTGDRHRLRRLTQLPISGDQPGSRLDLFQLRNGATENLSRAGSPVHP